MSNFLRRLGGLITLVGGSLGLLVLVAGVPLGLSLGIGFPGSLPTWGDVVNQLQIQGIPTPVVLYTLAFVCWLLWAYLMWSLAADLVGMARQSQAERRAGTRPGRWISGPLIASVVLGFHLLVSTDHAARPASSSGDALAPRSVAAAVYAPERVPLAPGTGRALLAGAAPSPAGGPDQEVQVRPGDSLWAIAGREYRDPTQWPRIWNANQGQKEDNGSTFTDPSKIDTGWELTIPDVPVAPRASASNPAPTPAATPPAAEPSAAGPPAMSSDQEVTVEPGDSLWAIAGREYGNPTEWPQIWDANADQVEDNGYTFTDPSEIDIGWELEVPSPQPPAAGQPTNGGGATLPVASPSPTGSPSTPPAPTPTASPGVAPPRPTTQPVHQRPLHHASAAVAEQTDWLVTLAEGGLVGLGLAAAIESALAAARRHERRRWRTEEGTRSRSRVLALGPNVSLLRSALARRRVVRRATKPADPDGTDASGLLGALHRPDALPGTVPVGPRSDGEGDVTLGIEDLSGLCLGGSGGVGAARALAISLLAHNPDARADLAVLRGSDGAGLVPGLADHPGVEVHADASHLIERLDSEVACRQRTFAGHEAGGFRGAVGVDGALSALIAILPARAVDALANPAQVADIVSRGRRLGVGVLCVGVPTFANPELSSLMVGAHGAIDPSPSSPLATTRQLYHLSRSEAGELLRSVAAGDGPDLVPDISADEEVAAAVPDPVLPPPVSPAPAADHPVPEVGTAEPKPVEISIFGPVRVLVRGEKVRLGIPNPGYEVLALLVVRGRGLTKEEGVDALGDGDASPEFGYRWDNGVRKTRRTLRGLVGGVADCIPCDNGVYELDRRLVDSDYWRLVSGVQAAHAASDPHVKRVLLEEATSGIEGVPFARAQFTWLALEQEDVRRRGMLALAELAELQAAEGEPDAAIATLERALTLDPNPVEDLFRRMMLIQHRFGRDQAARDTYAQLRDRLRIRLEVDPEEETEQLMEAIRAGRPKMAE